jgi:hypothetical protein
MTGSIVCPLGIFGALVIVVNGIVTDEFFRRGACQCYCATFLKSKRTVGDTVGSMAWDTDATQKRILDAAITDFSERGCSGAPTHQISRISGCNRKRIYFYFGGKAGL